MAKSETGGQEMGFRRVAAAIAAVGALVVVGVMPGQAATLDDMKAAGTLK